MSLSAFSDFSDAPIIACTETNYYLRVGASVTFSCKVKSNPHSKIKWQVGDSGEPENTVVKERVGIYRC